MKLGCEKQKMAIGCYHYANLLIKNGHESLANKFFEKGCKLGNRSACSKERWKVAPIQSPTEVVTKKTEFKEKDVEMVKTETMIKASDVNIKIAMTTTKEEFNNQNQTRQKFTDLFLKCEKAENKLKHPIIPDFVVVETVHGMIDGKCKYTQTMPNNGLMTCLLNESEKKSFAKDPSSLGDLMDKVCDISGY
jgi:hypothetical protein